MVKKWTVPMPLILRKGLPFDANACVDILRNWVKETPWMPAPDERQEMLEYWGGIFENDLTWVAEKENRIIGFCTLSGDLVGALYVLPEERNTSVGKQLLDLAKTNSDHITLWAYEKNKSALKFYQRECLVQVSQELETETNLIEIKHRWVRQNDSKEPV